MDYDDLNKRFIDNYQIRALDYKLNENILLIGTAGSEIYECQDQSPPKDRQRLHSHNGCKLYAVACSSKNYLFVTSGSDKRLKMWDMEK